MKKLVKFFKNWIWFLFILKRNEFHYSLELDADEYFRHVKQGTVSKYNRSLIDKRNLAHRLDNQWTDFCIKVKKVLDLPRVFK